MLGQLTGYQGSILYDKKELSCYDINTFYEQMAYIEQNVFLFDTSIRNNITVGNSYCEDEIDKVLKMSALEEDIRTFPEGLGTKVGENGKNLSGGQKQQIALARAFLKDAPILILDEATASLDPQTAASIMDVITELMRSRSTMLITHDEKVAAMADSIVKLS